MHYEKKAAKMAALMLTAAMALTACGEADRALEMVGKHQCRR